MWKTPAALLSSEFTLGSLELLEVALPQKELFQSAVGTRTERRALLVRWWDRESNWGIGENSCRPDPFFNGEFVQGAFEVIERHLFPILPREGTIQDLVSVLSRIRDWNFTRAAVLDSVLDLLRRRGRKDALDSWPGERLQKIPVGISLGLFQSPEAAVSRVQEAVEEGYHRVKLKISPSVQIETLKAVRLALPGLHLGLDANGSLDNSDAVFLSALAGLQPAALEQPFAPRRLDLCRELKQNQPHLRLCLDESITCIGDLITAHQIGALDEVNLKPGRVGGQLEAIQILEYAATHDLPVWVGGMFESGIGRHANLRYASRLPEAKAHDLSPSARYFESDLVKRPVQMDAQGYVDLSEEGPVDLDEKKIETMTVRRVVVQ